MIEISFKVKEREIDETINKLVTIGLESTYYDAPYEVTINSNGYGFIEKEDEYVDLKVYPEESSMECCEKHIDNIVGTLNIDRKSINMTEIKDDNYQQPFEAVDLKNGWVIAEPGDDTEYKIGKINFESQGSFGTGLHETTQDLLRYILEDDFENLSVLDLGTGSGILSLAVSIRRAEKITALDIRDVTEEVLYNAGLNNLSNIDVVINDVTKEDAYIDGTFDVVIINIGGEETLASMNLIDSVLKKGGRLFVSGLVEWSASEVLKSIEDRGYTIIKKCQTNEWVTAILSKNDI